MASSDDESQHSEATNSSDWITEASNSNELMYDSDSSQCSLFSSKSEEKFVMGLLDALERNRSKFGIKFLENLVNSNDPKDKETLNSSVIEIVKDDHTVDLQYLISKQAIDLNAKDYVGDTILSLAVSYTSIKVVKVLLDHMTDSDVDRYNQEKLLSLGILNILPELFYTEDAIAIVNLLQNKNLFLTLKNKLAILRFLMHDVPEECLCEDTTSDISNNIDKLISYGSLTHIKHVVNKIKNEISSGSLKYDMDTFYLDISRPLMPGVLLELYVEEDIKNYIEELIEWCIDSGYIFKTDHGLEWKWMESPKLNNNVNLRELLTKHPRDIYDHVKNLDFHKICKRYTIAGDYMKSLKAKSLIRHQLEEFLLDFVAALLPPLPDLCFDNVMSHIVKLSNEDLLNMCKAAVPKEKQIANKDSFNMALNQWMLIEEFHNSSNGESYSLNDAVKFVKSNDPKDKPKLNSIIAQIVDEDSWETLHYLFNKGYKIEVINDSGQTFLHCAFYKGGFGILSTGMKYWVPHITEEVVKIVDSNGLTILHVACYAYSTEKFIEKCLKFDVDVNAIFQTDPEKQERDGFTPLHFAAVNYEGSNWMKLIIDHNANVNAKDSRGRTPLHIACRVFEDLDEKKPFGVYVKRIGILLDGNADINAKDNEGNTPLLSLFPECYDVFTVLEYNIFNVPVEETTMKLKLLLERGADVKLSNNDGETIVHLIIKSLENSRCPHEFATPTNTFHDNDQLEMIRQIFTTCPDFDVNVRNDFDETPLQLAIFYLSSDIVKFLLDRCTENLEEFQDEILDRLISHRLSNNVLPRVEEVANFLSIIELLISKNLEIDSKQNLDMLTYLIHENCDGECGYFKLRGMLIKSTNLMDIVNFGSSSHLQSVYEKLTAHTLAHFQALMFCMVIDNLTIRKYGNFYVDSMFPQNFTSSKKLDAPITGETIEKLESELDRMKSTKMRESVTLYDVMTKHPHTIYQYVADVDIDSIVRDYSLYKDIIRGHLSKSLVRHYVEKSGFEYLKDLLPSSCPSLCCKQIIEYLGNEDILNVYRAVLDDYLNDISF